ncbi:MAG TPA: sigma-54 dependent transcriptional regulator [Blastocatellia bacterium]|nr:sigma-54 dependent transcriptional regulator [Blastocatellia bacterium]
MKQAKILLLDLDLVGGLGDTLRGILQSSVRQDVQLRQVSVGFWGVTVGDGDLSRAVSGFNPDVVFLVLPLNLLKHAGTLFQSVREELLDSPIIVVMEAGEPDEVFKLLRLGASDFITPPLKATDIFPRVWRLLEKSHRREGLTCTLRERRGLKQLVGMSPAFLAEIQKIPLVAKCSASVLISGETGTGKELCARAIHYLSPRAGKPFIPVSCGAIPVELVENELFGHERGAFTGASRTQFGLIREADGGTLFLDEIDCLPLPAQAKLLRFLQEKEYRPLGGTKIVKADVRVIAATNINLEEAVSNGKLRQDLYYRLNVISITLPPLRERREDIPLLARHFLAKYAAEFNKPVTDFSGDAMHRLMLYDWPGNVRELEHVVERAVVLSEQPVIRAADIILPRLEVTRREVSFREAKAKVVAQFERTYIQGLLRAYHGNVTKAAQAAGKNRRAFWQLMRKHGIVAQSFKPRVPEDLVC